MNKKVAEAVNRQITAEFFSGYLYLQMAAWFEERDLKGFANWMRVQAQEESCHGLVMFNYMTERGAPVVLGKIEAPESGYKSIADVFAKTLKHERAVTASINAIMDLAVEARDHATRIAFEWFVSEQIEEEAGTSALLEKIKQIGDAPGPGVMMLDSTLAQRVFVMPAPLAAKGTGVAP